MTKTELFLSFLKIGIIGFGGGSALIPVVSKELVTNHKAMSEEEYLKHVVVASVTPGAQPIKLGATCGYQLGGVAGSLLAAYGVMLPSVLLTLGIMALFSLLGGTAIQYFNYASVGITAFIVFVLLTFVKDTVMAGSFWVNAVLCGLASVLTGGKEVRQLTGQLMGSAPPQWLDLLPDCSTIHLIGTFFLLLMVYTIATHKKGSAKKPAAPLPMGILLTIAVLLGVPIGAGLLLTGGSLQFLAKVCLSTLTSFGGGAAYISVADGIFVQGGYIAPEVFYTQLVPVANALPGPMLTKVAAGIGLVVGSAASPMTGWLLAGVSALTVAGSCSAVALLVMQLYDTIGQSALIRNLKLYILPVICGMLLSTSLSMVYESTKIT
ncbi:MAG: chromate transporter, partial [Angelakisella sp.]